MQEPLYLGKVSNMVQDGMDANTKLGMQRFSSLDIRTHQICILGMTILILVGRFFETNFDVDYIMDTMHSPLYQTNAG